MQWQGSFVAIVTPMQPNGDIAWNEYKQLIQWHQQAGISGIVVGATTGEAPTLSDVDLEQLIRCAIDTTKGQIPIIASTGTNSTAKTIAKTQKAKELGADACLVVTPYYNRPTQKGLIAHYTAVADVGLPVILYNVPSRTGCDCLPSTVITLSSHTNIVGIKESTGDITRVEELLKSCHDFAVLTGEDGSAYSFMKAGCRGLISVTANVMPVAVAKMIQACLDGKWSIAEVIHQQLMPLHKALFLETNPTPVKCALALMGKIPSGIRLPLLPLDSRYHAELKEALVLSGAM